MQLEKIVKPSFAVIGKEGSADEGEGFVQRLWEDANAHFDQIAHLAKRDENGDLVGFWGAMSDLSRSFMPWEDFKMGLYLAGVECADDAQPPEGWVKWVLPGFEFLRAEAESGDTFTQVLDYLERSNIALAGAVQDFSCPKTGKDYMLFPIRRL